MAIAERALKGQTARQRAWKAGVRLPAATVAKTVSALGRLVFGSGGGYRSYGREGFPEHELHQIVAGRKDRFDGFM
jgi:hypothetical protein